MVNSATSSLTRPVEEDQEIILNSTTLGYPRFYYATISGGSLFGEWCLAGRRPDIPEK